MRCLLFTVNIAGPGTSLCDNARNSFLAACNRWKFDYLEIASPLREGYYPSYQKLFFLAEQPSYETVMYVDADVLIRSDTPSPVIAFEEGLHLVSDLQEHQPAEARAWVRQQVHANYYEKLPPSEKEALSLDSFLRSVRNAGVIIQRGQAAKNVFSSTARRVPPPGTDLAGDGHYEQFILNFEIARNPDCAKMAPNCWNCIAPCLDGPMDAFVYHFTGYGFKISHSTNVETYAWKVAA